jgi:rhamnosyltransferase
VPSHVPQVAVLLATHDGARWLPHQLESIAGQAGVRVSVVASDDASEDGSPEVLESFFASHPGGRLLPGRGPFGSSTGNFLRLFREADLGDAEFVALADQDDVWEPGKLAQAVEALRAHGCDGYSSSVTTWHPDGTRRLLDKAQPQRRFDHLFESPGPGCTFLLTRALADRFRAFAVDTAPDIDRFSHHDWLIYAFARSTGHRWHIDPTPRMLYRQHRENEVGANVGLAAFRRRVARVQAGWYAGQIALLCGLLRRALGVETGDVDVVERWIARRPRLGGRLAFVREVGLQARRRARDRQFLVLLALSGAFWGDRPSGEAVAVATEGRSSHGR